MDRRAFLALTATGAALAALPAIAQTAGETTMTEPRTGFAPVNGLELYYEIHGEGEPLLMLHGGIGAHEQFGANLAELAKTRQVIVAHMQGHGKTRDIVDRPYSYPQFADDTAALVDHLGLGAIDVLGHSLGAGVALRLAIQHPEKVRRLIVVSGTMALDGMYPNTLAAFPAMIENAARIGAGVAQSPLAQMYPDVDWTTAFRKMGELESDHWDWTDEIDGIKVPVLLIFADADTVRPEHIVAFYQKFGGFLSDAGLDANNMPDASFRPVSRLAIIAGRTHYNLMETLEVSAIVEKFLTEVPA